MPEFFAAHPGRLYVLATLSPLIPAAILLVVITARNLTRPHATAGGGAGQVYRWLNWPGVDLAGAWLSVACMAIVVGLALYGYGAFVDTQQAGTRSVLPDIGTESWLDAVQTRAFQEDTEWIRLSAVPGRSGAHGERSISLPLGYHVDILSSLMFGMVAIVGTMIFIFSIGYMAPGTGAEATADAHGRHHEERLGRYFLLLNLFVSAMFNLLLASNLLQVFISWELVGVCSYFLISYYNTRPAAGWAANKAFVANRIGDAGFLMAIALAWGESNTLLIAHLQWFNGTSLMPYPFAVTTTQTLIGLGLFIGCVGKSAQFPLQVWLPDAMSGPTPVSALIHAATMVAAGVYLVTRCYAMFTPDVLLVIAYTGCITVFIAATAACVQTDIKKVLAYSTASQLGFMMLALGVGGWAAGVFHLLTHAFFKALLFLGAGSVIHGLHYEQDLRKMGGIRRKMPITAYTMLVGVLAISGFPLLSGWYSKEAVLGSAAVAGLAEPANAALTVIPFLSAGLTAFYMFRMWLLVFTGNPRDARVHESAHESPLVMTLPLVVLAVFAVIVGWGWPLWEPDASVLLRIIAKESPSTSPPWLRGGTPLFAAYMTLHKYHLVLELAAGGIALLGFAVAYWRYAVRTPTFAEAAEPTGFLARGWYFDALYDRVIRRPTQAVAAFAARFDKASPDGPTVRSLDGLLSGVGRLAGVFGGGLRALQTGRVRGYVAVLGLTIVGVLGMLAVLTR